MMLPIRHERCRLPQSLRKRAILRRRLNQLRLMGEVSIVLGSAVMVALAMWALIG